MKKTSLKIFIIIILILIISIAIFIYIGSPKEIKLIDVSEKEKSDLINELKLNYIPSEINLINLEIPKLNTSTYFYINYSFKNSEKDKFIEENYIYKNRAGEISLVREENDMVSVKQILTERNNYKLINDIIRKEN